MEKAAEAFASRVRNNDNQQVARRAIGLAYSRSATDEELGVIDRFLARQSQNHRAGTPGKAIDEDTARHKAITDLCHMLLASNEFAYID
jgi:DNA-binding GntR family transcriptional regulator